MPKIVRIINRFNLGGPSYNAAYLSRELSPTYETVLLGGSPLPDEAHSGFIMDGAGVQYEELASMTRSINPFQDIGAYREISSKIRSFAPQIVHTHAAKAGALGRIAAWRNHVPVVVHTFHGHVFSSYFGNVKSKILQQTERFLASKSDAIIAISKSQRDDLVEKFKICPSDKTHIIPLGLDLDRFSKIPDEKRNSFRNKYNILDDEITIGIIGRFAPVKNHILFFQTLQELKSSTTIKFKAIVVGDGDLRKEFENIVSELGLRDQVVFTSWIQQVEEVLTALDIVVLTSLSEGTPVSLIEAQAARRPVVSTDVGGVRDCILDGQSGILVSGFDASSFANSVLTLMKDESKRKSFGEKGHEFVHSRFSYHRMVSDVRELYEALMKEKKISF